MRKLSNHLFFALIIVFFSFVFIFNFSPHGDQQFSYLANSFLSGKLYFTQEPQSWGDTSLFLGKYYWPLGPFPAILLMPLVYLFNFFGSFFYQGYLQFFLVLAVFILVYKISLKTGYSKQDSRLLAFAFCFASVFMGVAFQSWSWYFSQVIATFLLFLAMFEYLTRRRPAVIGIIIGLVLATRITASLALVFFVLSEVFSHNKISSKIRNVFKLVTPGAFFLILLFIYNYQRFGNIFEQGYKFQILVEPLVKAREYGIVSISHLSGNLYYFFISGPLLVFRDGISHVLKYPFIIANPWGMSIFVTSPYFVYLFFLKYKDKISRLLLITIVVISIPIFLYYGLGFSQFGYRYSLDFLPFLFYMLIRNYRLVNRKLSFGFKIFILLSGFFDLYLFLGRFYLRSLNYGY
ncbi:hypothetical protein A3D00_03220 [Candidatus Woesebacteria bacterium RIFCSPHIGHO2_02_FULL_38_9]|uniref:Glycosyltransferase RgtA/B/C/D-like domain-containing protein n=1 Tax=Candidatus Woesebacteria bacterium RIFCSPHIGHO2_01_FULL_39_28 TaxID=1802496 RepID=A0A1F7YHX9_9BACT|nr:MAG: hypothetical protein A2627_05665 [Candidatus Woesebacteria bacterium RIFCSPHIGHO2_01_FULL_39_28]OGM31479.1 MAG: hypothetical protein A3D00_03220 [Candidatus Woesebacteria bacterium RIFCSPHIGHO2_02_FULL_38_9]OGM56665.1 MAG: hypothetical protein A3A50_04860 [Candidatus Woesebacteria bacterium RIFCSPLOWO2_01_FULL_38_20]